MARRQKDAIKDTIVILKAKLEIVEADPDGQDFFSMKLLVQDLTKIQADICTAIQNGTQWSTINFSCTRDELDKWRVTASSILYDLEHIKKGQETQKAAISEAYKKNVIVAKFPKIKNKTDWAEVMLRWKKEQCHLLDEFSKFAALKSCLFDPCDIGKGCKGLATALCTTYSKVQFF